MNVLYYFTIDTSILLFFALPSGVSFSAIRAIDPIPLAATLDASIPFSISLALTAKALS